MKIGILNAYHNDLTPGNYQENYMPMFGKFLQEHLVGHDFIEYKIAQNQFPEFAHEAYIISGSPKSVYDVDEWVLRLLKWIRAAHLRQKKIVGICFGHQAIAKALGGAVEKSTKGWGVGVRKFKIIEHSDFMNPRLKTCNLLFSHQDQVTKLPPDAVLLGEDEFCPHQMFKVKQHVFAMQGHPEFTADYARLRLKSREQIIDKDKYDIAFKSLSTETHSNIIGKWINYFFEN